MIELQGLCVGYPGQAVLENITLSFQPGQVLILLGPNGCGKSTLLRTAMGLQPKTGGQVLLDGVPLEKRSAREIARKAAYLAQSRTVPNITARRMVLHGRFPYLTFPRRYRPQDHEAARRALEWADASDVADRPMQELSGGQRQKVYLAMALAQDTETILMDEPTTYLDVGHQLDVMDVARRLAGQGKAVVVVLHDLCLAMRSADEIAVLSEGRLAALGTPEAVYASGILDKVFAIKLGRMETETGFQYYCTKR
ncbi:MAG: ABC transporter ATP-binding protein [Oscillibacter sp.]|nr:ABC transporter ATP-binding protein [Oscillibacter sp.]